MSQYPLNLFSECMLNPETCYLSKITFQTRICFLNHSILIGSSQQPYSCHIWNLIKRVHHNMKLVSDLVELNRDDISWISWLNLETNFVNLYRFNKCLYCNFNLISPKFFPEKLWSNIPPNVLKEKTREVQFYFILNYKCY